MQGCGVAVSKGWVWRSGEPRMHILPRGDCAQPEWRVGGPGSWYHLCVLAPQRVFPKCPARTAFWGPGGGMGVSWLLYLFRLQAMQGSACGGGSQEIWGWSSLYRTKGPLSAYLWRPLQPGQAGCWPLPGSLLALFSPSVGQPGPTLT